MLIAHVLSHYIVNPKGCLCVPAKCRYFSGKMSLKVREGAAIWAVYARRLHCRLTSFSRSLQTILRINLDGTVGRTPVEGPHR